MPSSVDAAASSRASPIQTDPQLPPRKKRKSNLRAACDECRQRKVRCDGQDMPGKGCSFCAEHEIECTYTIGKPRKVSSLNYYKKRAAQLETLIKRLMPNMDITAELEKLDSNQTDTTSTPATSGTGITNPGQNQHRTSVNKTTHPKDRAEQDGILLPDDFSKMHSCTARFHGKSSAALLIHEVMKVRTEKTGVRDTLSDVFRFREKDKLWIELPWDHDLYRKQPPVFYTFPDEDLMLKLIDIYLSDANVLRPLFHRPTFTKYISESLYLTDDSFGTVVLLVCANAARQCDDPRVFHETESGRAVRGWQWFEQVRIHGRSFITAATLHDLQIYILLADYVSLHFTPQGAWILVGLGLRAAQDVGAHNQKMYAPPLTIEQELWRRAWWTLIHMDRAFASTLGRPLGIHDEEFDVEPPIECDDEYWEHPDIFQAWVQPPGRPATVSYFVQKLKLNQILARALRTIYAVDKARIYQGLVGEDWEPRVIAELDSSLNMWIDSLPDHLRWNPQCADSLWFQQSVMLHADYYLLQILVHMPFITTKESPLSFPSLAICTNAARACSHLVAAKDPRLRFSTAAVVWPLFLSAIVLLLNIWGGKKAGLQMDSTRALRDIRMCQEVMEQFNDRFVFARRLWHILQALTVDLDVCNTGSPSHKRTCDGLPKAVAPNHPREDAPPRMATRSEDPCSLEAKFGEMSMMNVHESLLQTHFRTLPLSTNDLQREPLFPSPSSSSQERQPHDTEVTFDAPLPLPLHNDEDQTRLFAEAMQQLPFFNAQGDWGSAFSSMQDVGNPEGIPSFDDSAPSGYIPYQDQQQTMGYENPMFDTGPSQTSHSLGQNNWEAYLSNVSELLKDIDSWEGQ